MEIGKAGERKVVETISRLVRKDPDLIADFDEDAAILDLDSGKFAVTTDMGHAGTHFLTDDPRLMGRKIVTSNATDLLAKGAVPKYMLISVGLPARYELDFVKRLYRSMDTELKRYGAYVIGGDTNKSREFVYSVTMIGKVVKPLLRSGARTGDFVVLTGQIGNAAAGYIALKKKLKAVPTAFAKAQLEPSIDFELCKRIIPTANAGIDVSDGLAFELGEIARLSRKKIVIRWDELPAHPDMLMFCAKNGLDVQEILLNHGEDYQLVYTTPDPSNGIIIGEVRESGKGGVILEKGGKREKLEPKGYEHFRSN